MPAVSYHLFDIETPGQDFQENLLHKLCHALPKLLSSSHMMMLACSPGAPRDIPSGPPGLCVPNLLECSLTVSHCSLGVAATPPDSATRFKGVRGLKAVNRGKKGKKPPTTSAFSMSFVHWFLDVLRNWLTVSLVFLLLQKPFLLSFTPLANLNSSCCSGISMFSYITVN